LLSDRSPDQSPRWPLGPPNARRGYAGDGEKRGRSSPPARGRPGPAPCSGLRRPSGCCLRQLLVRGPWPGPTIQPSTRPRRSMPGRRARRPRNQHRGRTKLVAPNPCLDRGLGIAEQSAGGRGPQTERRGADRNSVDTPAKPPPTPLPSSLGCATRATLETGHRPDPWPASIVAKVSRLLVPPSAEPRVCVEPFLQPRAQLSRSISRSPVRRPQRRLWRAFRSRAWPPWPRPLAANQSAASPAPQGPNPTTPATVAGVSSPMPLPSRSFRADAPHCVHKRNSKAKSRDRPPWEQQPPARDGRFVT